MWAVLKNAINIPQDVFQVELDSLKLSGSKSVLLYDLHGYNSMDVVEILRAKGFTNIYNLFEGFAAFICDHALNKKLRDQLLTGTPAYQLVDPKAGIDLLKQDRNLVILDTRPQDQYDNKAIMGHMNVGRMKGAIHLTSLDSLNSILAQKDKSTQFMVYGSGDDLGTMVCEALIRKGFKQ